MQDNTTVRITPEGALSRLRAWLAPLPLGPFRSVLRSMYALLSANQSTVRIGNETLRFVLGTEPVRRIVDQPSATNLQTLLAFASSIREGDLIADVGAHVGTYAVVAAARSGAAGRVIAFEPASESRAIMARNLQLNRIGSRVTIIPAAVTDRTGEVAFFASGSDSQNTTLPLSDPRFGASTVQSLRLDDFFRDLGRDPDVVKIDVEGAELAVLRGAQRIVQGPARIVCDLHPYAWASCGHDWSVLQSWVHANGRTLVDVLSGRELTDEWFGPALLLRSDEL